MHTAIIGLTRKLVQKKRTAVGDFTPNAVF
jgi:hypothetical protein